jgi:ribose 5-phosphate isomerase B
MPVRFVVGADDEGEAADAAIDELRRRGHEVEVLDRDQWPDVAGRVARAVAEGDADQGLLFCWTGTGTSMAANKVRGVRAALAWEPWIAEGARRWNDANVLAISLRSTSEAELHEILDAWFSSEPSSEPGDRANVARLEEMEAGA